MRIAAALVVVALLACGLLTAPTDLEPWAAASMGAPLGADEFGRNLLLVLLVAAGRSLAFGTALAAAVLALAAASGWLLSGQKKTVAGRAFSLASLVVESVPLFLWILLAYTTLARQSLAAAALAMTVGVLPFAANVLVGEFERVRREPFVEAARLSGSSGARILLRHVLPNAAAVIGPLFVLVLGLSLAIPGAVGVLGFGRRTDYDLGTILLRGKENVAAHPILLMSAIAALGVIYVSLDVLRRPRRSAPPLSGPATLQ